MRRREFIRLLGSAAASPFAARAQQGAIRRVGVLMGFAESDHGAQSGVAVFREELRKLGWTAGRNIEIDIRWATAVCRIYQPSFNTFCTNILVGPRCSDAALRTGIGAGRNVCEIVTASRGAQTHMTGLITVYCATGDGPKPT